MTSDRLTPGGAFGPAAAARRAGGVLLLALAVGASAARAAVVEISGDDRLIRGFVEDGDIVRAAWIGVSAAYAGADEGRDLLGEVTAAFRVGEDVEAGLVAGVLNRDRDAGAELFGSTLRSPVDGTGLSDVLLYGKYRLLRSPVQLAVGAATTVPIADEANGRGPGSPRYEIFAGLRKGFTAASVIWSLAVVRSDDAEPPGAAEGRTALRVGFGLLAPLSRIWLLVAEAQYESARYDGDRQRAEVEAGLAWKPTENTVIRGEVGAGLTDAADDFSAVLSAAFYF
ncbi:MAG: hypothetical protein ACE5JH_09645 [Acidobacteriota bacterium]